MQTEEKRENIEEKKEERMEMPVSGALERGSGNAPVSGAEISVHDTENGHPSEDVYILAIESSCDETAASVVKNGRTVLSNIISSQIDLHTLFGGVVPEIASRKHIEKINQVIEEALTEAHMSLEEMTAIAVTVQGWLARFWSVWRKPKHSRMRRRSRWSAYTISRGTYRQISSKIRIWNRRSCA